MSVERCNDLSDTVAFAQYGGAIARAIQRFKYEDAAHLADPLGALLRRACARAVVKGDVVLPVPLHPRRLARRGYNQSALLAQHVAVEIGARVSTSALVRVVDTPPQAELSRDARASNVRGAFRVRNPARVSGRSVVVVDDVSTTGATLGACEAALRASGAARVTSVVLARTTQDQGFCPHFAPRAGDRTGP